jgi:hypothetical protein
VFALPGICGLIVFLLARPQEFEPALQKLPFLYLFCAAAIGGYIVDLKLRRLEPIAAPNLIFAALFLGWCVICDAVEVPGEIVSHVIEVGILATVFGTIAHGASRFRSMEVVAGVTMATCLFIAFVCWHQGHQPDSCVAISEADPSEGTPDGRECDTVTDCYSGDPQPGMDYHCEKVGLFGTFSVEDRVRYRGELHDPNEVALTICAGGLAFAIAFAFRRRDAWGLAFGGFAVVLVAWTVVLTESRGGEVVFLAVPGVYFIKRYGWKGALLAAALAIPVLLLGGRSDESADESTFLRYEAWGAGLDMFRASPIFGVGHRQFADHWTMTAHNSYVLTLAELGMIGFFLFTSLIWMSVKTLWRGVRDLEHVPGADAARTWGLALLAAFAGLIFQIHTLSFAYHPVLWIFFGFAGAYGTAVKNQRPMFNVQYTLYDGLGILGVCVLYTFAILPLYLKWKHAI